MRTLLVLSAALLACDDADPRDAAVDSSDAAVDSIEPGDVAADSDDAAVDSADARDATPAISFCEGTTTFAWDPANGDALAAFPNDALTVDDPKTITGLRVSIGEPAWLGNEPPFFQPVWRQLESLDGFGTSAGIVLRFSAPLAAPPSGSATATSDIVALFDLGVTPPARVPYEAEVLDGGATLILWPMRPLREATLHGVVVTLPDQAGGCVAPSEPLRKLLSHAADTPALERLQRGYDALVAAADGIGVLAGDIGAATVFTTQAFTQATLAQRDDLAAQAFTWKSAPACTTHDTYRSCVGDFMARDYRIEGALDPALDGTFSPKTYRLPVHLWLPLEATGPAPVLVFGHGLGGDADQAELIAELAATQGMATIAISAPRHGDHPTATSSDPQAVFTEFFGIDLQAFTIDGFVFRENLRQAAFDKLQVLELLADTGASIDGTALDLGHVAYWGISLGGIFGPGFVGLSDRVGAAILSVPGGRLISIVSEADDFSQFFDLLATLSQGADNLLRQAPVAQALIDGADPVNWAAHLLEDRVGRPGAPAPQVLVQMVIGDTTVPNVATRSLTRAMALPQVPTIIVPIDGLPAATSAPVQANLGAALTGGIFQFDRASSRPGGNPRKATHGGVFEGIEAIGQVQEFLDSWLADDAPTIIDPYAVYGTPPL